MKSQDRQLFFLGKLRFFVYFLVLQVNRKKKTKKKTKQQRIRVYIYRSWKLIFFTKTTLVLANTPVTNGFTYEKRLSMLKDEIQKRSTSKNTSGQQLLALPMCNVMYSTICCTVTIHSTICKKHLKCESGNNSTKQ